MPKPSTQKETSKSLTNCTYAETGPVYTKQTWYECGTCKSFCCDFCKLKCHENHQLSEGKSSDFYCDCGCSSNCKGLIPVVFSIKKENVTETYRQDMNILYIFGYFPESSNPKFKEFFKTTLFENSKLEKNVRLFVVEDDDEFEDVTFEFYKSKREFGFKEITEEDLKGSEMDAILFDLDLYFKANYLAHKNPVPLDFEGIIDEDDDEEEEEDDEDDEEAEEETIEVDEPKLKKQKLQILEDDDDDEEDDEDFNPDEDDDDDEYETDEEEEQPNLRAIGGSGQSISHEDLMPFWSETYQSLNIHTLHFTTFRNSCSKIVKDLLFNSNPVMKQLADISEPPPPDHRDLLEILRESNDFENLNPQAPKEIKQEIEGLLKLKKNIKEWDDESDYEFSEDNKLEDTKNEWKIFGGDLLRLNVGTWSISGLFKANFRFKVDIVNKQIIYHMFDFKIDQKKVTTKDECIKHLTGELKKFKESNQYKIVISLDNITALQYHASVIDPSLSLLVYDLKEKPAFFVKKIQDEKWNEIEDFSENFQASKCKRHSIVGYDEEFSKLICLMTSVSKNCAELYESDKRVENVESLVYFDENDKNKKNENAPFLSNLEDVQENCCIQ